MPSTPPYLRHEPSVDPIPLVLDSPHSGEHYPDDFDHAPPRELVRQAEDTHVARLYGSAPGLGATLIEANFPRAYIDANRSLDRRRHRAAGGRLARADRPVAQVRAGRRPGVAPRARRRADVRTQARRGRGAAADRRLVPAVSPGARGDARRAARRVRRGVARQLPFDARARRRIVGRPGARARRLRSRRPRRHDLRRGVHVAGRGGAPRDGVRGGGQRPLQGRRARAQARPSRRAPAQPADRDEARAVHGRAHAGAQRGYARLERNLERLLAAIRAHVLAQR